MRNEANSRWLANNPALSVSDERHEDSALGWWKETIKHFSPSWFAVTMGTGVVSNILYRLPFNGNWLYYLSIVVYVFNLVLFIAAIILSIIRYATWPKIWSIMLRDPHHSLYLGAIPTTLGTLINMFIYVCKWGEWSVYFAWATWMVLVILSLATAVSIPFAWMVRSHDTPWTQITAVQFIPITSTLVSAAVGGLIAEKLPAQLALGTIIMSWFLWGLGLPLAMIVLVMYYHRLTLKHLPPRDAIVSVFVPLSPIGQGSLAALRVGSAALNILPATGIIHPLAGDVIYIMSFLSAFLIWSFGMLWLVFAIGALAYYKRFPFNMGWWSFVFPLGSFALATIAVGQDMPSLFFRVLGTIFAVIVIILWLVVVVGTIYSAIYGQLLKTSSVSAWEDKRQQSVGGA